MRGPCIAAIAGSDYFVILVSLVQPQGTQLHLPPRSNSTLFVPLSFASHASGFNVFHIISTCVCGVKSADHDQTAFEQIIQTHIRLLQKEQSNQGLRCLQFHLLLFDALLHSICYFMTHNCILSASCGCNTAFHLLLMNTLLHSICFLWTHYCIPSTIYRRITAFHLLLNDALLHSICFLWMHYCIPSAICGRNTAFHLLLNDALLHSICFLWTHNCIPSASCGCIAAFYLLLVNVLLHSICFL